MLEDLIKELEEMVFGSDMSGSETTMILNKINNIKNELKKLDE